MAPSVLPAHPRRVRSRTRWAVLPLVLATTGLAACGGDGDEDAPPPSSPTIATLRGAVERTRAEGTADYRLRFSSTGTDEPVATDASGSLSFRSGRERASGRIRNGDRQNPVEVYVDRRSPFVMFVDRRRWEVDPGGYIGTQPGSGAEALAFVAAADGRIVDAGVSDLDGDPVRRYDTSVSYAALDRAVTFGVPDRFAEDGGRPRLQVSAWIDDEDRLVRVRTTERDAADGGPAGETTTDVVLDDLGDADEPTVPDGLPSPDTFRDPRRS